jgi:glucose 1-dehydrogenase
VRLDGQAALVTGGSSGIGAGVCRALAAHGAQVAVNYHGEAHGAAEVVRAIQAAGGRAFAVPGDVSSEREVGVMFEEAAAMMGRIDIVVANAGIQADAPFASLTAEAWDRVLDVNLKGQFLCAREAVRRFLAQPAPAFARARGKIVCMSSVHEVIPWAGHVNYAASKGGVMLMMKSLAQEVAPRGIRVNSIAPGAIRTPINRTAWETDAARTELLKLIPYGRIGEPEDVARVAVWLASEESDYVVGTTVFVDGGMCLYPGFAGNG